MDQQEQVKPASSQRWEARQGAAFVVRASIFIVPLVAGFFAGAAVSRRLPEPERVSQVVLWWVVTVAVASLAATIVDKFARRFLPLSTLLKMSMLFPDEAPSRLRVARRSGSVAELRQRVTDAGKGGDRTKGEAAELILALSAALGRHDRKTRGHSERVRAYVDMIAEELGLPQGDRDRLRWAALLHDVGKLEVDAEILNKDGVLNHEEWHAIQQHPIHGLKLIAPIVPWMGEWAQTIEHHHEQYDGSGYPYGLVGEDIAYGARIVAVADAYDVMTSGRSYQRARSPEQARREIVALSGKQFDPKVARALMRVALGRLRWATGPLAAIAQMPWSRGLPALGRDVITLAASSAIMTTSLVVGVVPTPADLPTREVVEVVIAGAGLTGDAIEALAGNDDTTLLASADDGSAGPDGSDSSVDPVDSAVEPDDTTTTTIPGGGSATTTAPPGPTTTTSPGTTTTNPTTTTSDTTSTTTVPPTTTTVPPTTTTTIPPTTTTTAPTTTTTTTIPPTTTTTTLPNSAPVAVADSGATTEGNGLSIGVLANDSDPDGDSLSLTGTTNPSSGSVTQSGSSVTYTPDPGFSGTDSFTYTVCDPLGACDSATVSITVAPDGAVSAADDTADIGKNGSIIIKVTANDSGLIDTSTLTVVSAPSNGTATRVGGSGNLRYTAEPGFTGTDTFTYEICSPDGSCDTAVVTVTVG